MPTVRQMRQPMQEVAHAPQSEVWDRGDGHRPERHRPGRMLVSPSPNAFRIPSQNHYAVAAHTSANSNPDTTTGVSDSRITPSGHLSI